MPPGFGTGGLSPGELQAFLLFPVGEKKLLCCLGPRHLPRASSSQHNTASGYRSLAAGPWEQPGCFCGELCKGRLLLQAGSCVLAWSFCDHRPALTPGCPQAGCQPHFDCERSAFLHVRDGEAGSESDGDCKDCTGGHGHSSLVFCFCQARNTTKGAGRGWPAWAMACRQGCKLMG